MDSLSRLFDLFRFETEVLHNARLCGDWLLDQNEDNGTCFHLPTEGNCLLSIRGGAFEPLNEGDLLILACDVEHKITAKHKNEMTPSIKAYDQSQPIDGVGLMCGKISFNDHRKHQIFNQLPEYFIIRNSEENCWLQSLLDIILHESYQNNSNAVINRLCEVMIIKAVRTQIGQPSNNNTNLSFMKLYADERISKAISLIHDEPSKPWEIESLASKASMSRTTFIKRFKKLSGWSVMQYVTWWRMQIAWNKLVEGNSVAATAQDIGYQSEAAFSRAFKREFGTTVGKVRRGNYKQEL